MPWSTHISMDWEKMTFYENFHQTTIFVMREKFPWIWWLMLLLNKKSQRLLIMTERSIQQTCIIQYRMIDREQKKLQLQVNLIGVRKWIWVSVRRRICQSCSVQKGLAISTLNQWTRMENQLKNRWRKRILASKSIRIEN